MNKSKDNVYNVYIKRALDLIVSFCAIIILSPILILLIISGTVAMKGNPFFIQKRPGIINPKTGKEKIFKLIKFRTMSNAKDENGNLLPDEKRLNTYGQFLRKTSLDEIPELFNIFIGDMSFVGPRPQLVRDMVFMSDLQRRRHLITPGLTGLAQTKGRNAIEWEEKLEYDLKYLQSLSFALDLKIIFDTFMQVVFRKKGVKGSVADEVELAEDFGDYLLAKGKISEERYCEGLKEAERILE